MNQIWENLSNAPFWYDAAAFFGRLLLIFIAGWILVRLFEKASKQLVKRFETLPDSHPKRYRAITISNLLGSTARYTVWIVVIFMLLSEIGFNMQGLLATAGVAGLAIGFGAQSLVKDVISGVFLLFDDMISVGDVIRVHDEIGVIEQIGVRSIRARKLNGEILMIPSGELGLFGNLSIDFARVIVNVGLAYEQDTDRALEIMHKIAADWMSENPDAILDEEPTIQAIIDFADSAVTARLMFRVKPGEQWPAERAIRLRLKKAFDENGVEFPFPRRTVYISDISTSSDLKVS